MDCKDEISDTDSGIILQSGPDSPTSPTKELAVHTRAVRLKHQALEERLELCLQELKRLCIREAQLIGQLPSDYPLMPGEKPPSVRRRIGAAFSLDRESFQLDGKDPELISLEAKLALQKRILEAARKLCLEEHLSRSVRRSRLQQSKREERKLKELQRALSQRRELYFCPVATPGDPGMLHDSSLSDIALLEEEVENKQSTPASLEHPCLEDPPEQLHHNPQEAPLHTVEAPRPTQHCRVEYECSPVKNSPWKESSLDQPYQKPKKLESANSSRSCSPVVTLQSTHVDLQLGDAPLPMLIVPAVSQAVGHGQASSAPCTPELQPRRPHFQSFRLPKHQASDTSVKNRGRGHLPRRRTSDLSMAPPEYSAVMAGLGKPQYASRSEDSSSALSVSSYGGSSCHDAPSEVTRLCPPPYAYHYMTHHNSSNGKFSLLESRLHRGPQNSNLYSKSSHNINAFYNYPNNGQHTGNTKGTQSQPGPSLCRLPQPQHTSSFPRGQVGEDLGYPSELDVGRLYLSLPPPLPAQGAPPQYDYGHEKAPPTHVRLARGPSLREYHQHHGQGAPQGIVSEELRSWRQRIQFREARSRSLDRFGFEQESLVPSVCLRTSQVSQRRILQRAPDGTPVRWLEEKDSEIVTQV